MTSERFVQAGAAVIDITPRTGAQMSGFLAREQPSVGIHDPLAARGLYLNDGRGRLLWLHADLVGLEREFIGELKKELGDRLGFRSHEIVISATHTHSGPATIRLINAGAYDECYLQTLKKSMMEVAESSVNSAGQAVSRYAEGLCDLATDRRRKASAHTDHHLAVLTFHRPDGSCLAVLANYPIHNVALRADNRLISADMAGAAAAKVTRELAGNPVVLMTNGACGNLNPPAVTSEFIQKYQPVPNYEQMAQWGDRIGDAVIAAAGAAEPLSPSNLSSKLTSLEIRLESMTADQIKARAVDLLKVYANETGYVADRYRDSIHQWERMILSRIVRPDWRPCVPTDIQLIQLGVVRFVCFGAEVFSVIADELRARISGPLYVVGYANGDAGYLAPSAAYDEGGYEVESAFVFYGGLPVKRGEFERMRDAVTAWIRAD